MQFDDLQTIKVDVTAGVATITLNRPERLNAYTVQMGAELMRTFGALDRSDDARVIVVTGAGRGFCAGMDLGSGGDTFADEDQWDATKRLEGTVRPWNIGTPIIAAINGPAVGIGATLPLQWDMRFASESARIGFVFTRRGIVPEAGSTWYLPRLIGVSKAMDLLITGRLLSSAEALEYGIVSRVFSDDELLSKVTEIARDIADNTAPASVAITKQLVWRQMMQTDPVEAKRLEDALFAWAGAQPDATEGVKSFLDKRKPAWTMSGHRDRPEELLPVLKEE